MPGSVPLGGAVRVVGGQPIVETSEKWDVGHLAPWPLCIFFCTATNSKVAEVSASVENSGDFDAGFRWSEKDHVHPGRHAPAAGDSESRPQFTGERMICEELASFPNGGKPLSGGTGIVTCDEIDDVEQV